MTLLIQTQIVELEVPKLIQADEMIVLAGRAETLRQAQSLIRAGRVFIDGYRVANAGAVLVICGESFILEIADKENSSRTGLSIRPQTGPNVSISGPKS